MLVEVNRKNYKKIIKNTRKYIHEKNIKYMFSDDLEEEIKENIKNIETAINLKKIEERYNFIYDTICSYLDNQYINNNLCGFDENNVCEYYRKIDKNHYNGCCYRSDRSLCNYFDEKQKKCIEKCISCKLYSCPYLRNRGINYKINEFPLIKYFFNIRQKLVIKYSFFKPKLYVMHQLMEKR